VAVAAVVLVPLFARSPGAGTSALRSTPDTLVARGGASSDGARPAGLEAFCVGEGAPLRELAPAGPGAPAPRCGLAAQLKLAIVNPGGYARVFLVGVDDAYDLLWYEPHPPATESVPAIASGPIGGAIKLQVNHAAGPLRIYGLFSDAPISAAAVTSAVERLKAEGRKPSATPTLPLEGVDGQRSLLVELEP
jgi:hypothetical protein